MFSVMTDGPYGDNKIEKLVVEMNRFYDSYDAAIAEIEKMEKTVNDIPSISKQEIKEKVDAFKDSFRYWVELRELLKASEELILRVFYVIGSEDADACREEFYKCREEWIELEKKFPYEEKIPYEKMSRKLYAYYDF